MHLWIFPFFSSKKAPWFNLGCSSNLHLWVCHMSRDIVRQWVTWLHSKLPMIGKRNRSNIRCAYFLQRAAILIELTLQHIKIQLCINKDDGHQRNSSSWVENLATLVRKVALRAYHLKYFRNRSEVTCVWKWLCKVHKSSLQKLIPQ